MQELTNGSTYSGSPSYLSDDDGKFLFRPVPSYNTCGFCQNNGEEEGFYRSHRLKDKVGVVECPILRKYVCPLCSATGDTAHTIKYCPTNRDGQYNGASLSELKKRRNASGKPGVQRGASSGRVPMVGHWVNEGQAKFNNGVKLDDAISVASSFHNNAAGQTSILFKEQMMKRELQQKSLELEQLKRQLNNHLNGSGCSGQTGMMPFQRTQVRRAVQGHANLPSPMEGHLRNREMDFHVPEYQQRNPEYQMPRTDQIPATSQRNHEYQMPRTDQNYHLPAVSLSNQDYQIPATNLGDQLAELREGTVPHES